MCVCGPQNIFESYFKRSTPFQTFAVDSRYKHWLISKTSLHLNKRGLTFCTTLWNSLENAIFVSGVKAVPEPMCVLATDLQLDEMVRFCTDPTQFSVLCIDPTFCYRGVQCHSYCLAASFVRVAVIVSLLLFMDLYWLIKKKRIFKL